MVPRQELADASATSQSAKKLKQAMVSIEAGIKVLSELLPDTLEGHPFPQSLLNANDLEELHKAAVLCFQRKMQGSAHQAVHVEDLRAGKGGGAIS